jgi:hypothetical protein
VYETPSNRDEGIRPDCPECQSWFGLHALSCSRYKADAPVTPLTEAELAELRAQPPSIWKGWPVEEYDQGLPVVEIRQDHLAALIEKVEATRAQKSSDD